MVFSHNYYLLVSRTVIQIRQASFFTFEDKNLILQTCTGTCSTK